MHRRDPSQLILSRAAVQASVAADVARGLLAQQAQQARGGTSAVPTTRPVEQPRTDRPGTPRRH